MKQIFFCLAAALIFNYVPVQAQKVIRSQAHEKKAFDQTCGDRNFPNRLLLAAPPSILIAKKTEWKKIRNTRRGDDHLPEISLAGMKTIQKKPLAPDNVPASEISNSDIVEQLKKATQELLDAIAPGKKEVWDKYLADGAIYADEEGRVLTKDELLKELTPLPKGYIGTIKMGEPKVLVQDNVIVLSHLDREDLELYGQKIVTYFHSTDTWAKQKDGSWRRVATQIMAIPNERKPAKVDRNTLDSYVGQYQIAPDVFYTITREGDRLYGQRTGRARAELLPLCGDVFYKKGVWRGEMVFERDANGKVVKMLDRRENNNLVWKKIK